MTREARLVLVGPPGAPCPQVADLLAARWQVPVVDTDAEVARAAGTSVADLLLDAGEESYRALETDAVAGALAPGERVVVLGSGAVAEPSTRERLASWRRSGGTVVLLDLPPGESAKAAGLNAGSVPGLGPTRARWRALYDERHALLAQVADVVVPVDGRLPTELADEVAALLDPQGAR